jgi:hypothetical protein
MVGPLSAGLAIEEASSWGCHRATAQPDGNVDGPLRVQCERVYLDSEGSLDNSSGN